MFAAPAFQHVIPIRTGDRWRIELERHVIPADLTENPAKGLGDRLATRVVVDGGDDPAALGRAAHRHPRRITAAVSQCFANLPTPAVIRLF